MIGTLIIKMLKVYKLNVLVFDPFLDEKRARELGVTKSSLENIFRECEIISNHLANNNQTKYMLDYHLFDQMKDNATFINTGRGQQVVESDLGKAMKEKSNRTALLDVTYPEPPENSHVFYSLENVILTPHIAGSVNDELLRMGEYMYEEFIALIEDKPLKYEVSLKMLETMA